MGSAGPGNTHPRGQMQRRQRPEKEPFVLGMDGWTERGRSLSLSDTRQG